MKKNAKNATMFLVCGAMMTSALPARAGLFSISPDKERKMGADAAREIESQAPIVRGPVADWVSIIGQRLAAVSDSEFKYSFKVIDSPEVNAFALPGGYVYVYTGIRKIAQTDDELAAILAHEITHAEQHHYAKQYKKSAKRGLLLGIGGAIAGLPNLAQQALGILDFSMTQKYSRQSETESDSLGMKRMARAGFNPQGMVSLLQKLSLENKNGGTIDKWFRSHPEGAKRAAAAQLETAEVRVKQAQNDPTVKPKFAPWTSETLQQLAGNAPPEIAPSSVAPVAETASAVK